MGSSRSTSWSCPPPKRARRALILTMAKLVYLSTASIPKFSSSAARNHPSFFFFTRAL